MDSLNICSCAIDAWPNMVFNYRQVLWSHYKCFKRFRVHGSEQTGILAVRAPLLQELSYSLLQGQIKRLTVGLALCFVHDG